MCEKIPILRYWAQQFHEGKCLDSGKPFTKLRYAGCYGAMPKGSKNIQCCINVWQIYQISAPGKCVSKCSRQTHVTDMQMNIFDDKSTLVN